MLKTLLEKAQSLGLLGPARVIYDRFGEVPYLSRFYIFGAPKMPDGSNPYTEHGNPKAEAVFPDGLGLCIHRFHVGDDGELHNHPWRWAISLILAGGYREDRRVILSSRMPPGVDSKEFRPGDINVLTAETFHRVDLLDGECWSLILTGPKTHSWGFWDSLTGKYESWRDFLKRVRSERSASV